MSHPTAAATPPPGGHAAALAARYPRHVNAARLYGPAASSDELAGLYRRLRAAHGAVAPVLLDGDLPAWLVLGYREARFVASRGDLYDRNSKRWNAWDLVPPDWPLLPAVGDGDSVPWVEGAEHERRSEAVHDVLAAVDLFELRSQCEKIADELVDAFADDGHAELMYQFAHRMSTRVIAMILGIPAWDIPSMMRDLVTVLEQGSDALAAYGRIMALLRRLVCERRKQPGFDVISRLVTHRAGLTDEEAVQDLVVLVLGGPQPTAHWIGNTLRLLLSDSRFATTLAGGRRSVGQAMAEVLWEDPPTATLTGRWAVRAGQLGGEHIQAGDMLLIGVAAANTDPAIRPDQAAGVGGNQAHLAFGHGHHRCPLPAQEFAEAIAESAVGVLLDRLPDVTLAGPVTDLVWSPAIWVRGLVALPVTFTPA